MSISSFFIFNKAKKILKDRHILLKEFVYINLTTKQVVIDKQDYSNDFKLNEIFSDLTKQTKEIKDIAEVLITKDFCEIKLVNNEKFKF